MSLHPIDAKRIERFCNRINACPKAVRVLLWGGFATFVVIGFPLAIIGSLVYALLYAVIVGTLAIAWLLCKEMWVSVKEKMGIWRKAWFGKPKN